MKTIIKLELRKNSKSWFFYCCFFVASAFLFLETIEDMRKISSVIQISLIIGIYAYMLHSLLQIFFTFLLVKDFEAGMIKELFFFGYSRNEIFFAKFIALFLENCIGMFFSVGSVFLWWIFQNTYRETVNGEILSFFLKIIIGNIFACSVFSAISMFCVILFSNVLAIGMLILLPGLYDILMVNLVEKMNAPKGVTIRYMINCFYTSTISDKEYLFTLFMMILLTILFLKSGLALFQKKEYH